MANQKDVRRIATKLPGATEAKDRFAFSVRAGAKEKGFAWVWLERIDPKKSRVPNPEVLAIRVADLLEKDLMLGLDKKKFFTEPHYNGFPAVLVRLPPVDAEELKASHQLFDPVVQRLAIRNALEKCPRDGVLRVAPLLDGRV